VTDWSVRRLNRLAEAIGAQRYLEIGVQRGVTFRQVTVPDRTGVDPRLVADLSDLENQHVRVLPLRSDVFFAGLPPGATFDLVFLDGLHTFVQTWRDLINTLLHAHHRTVVLIDDTVPVDPWSAIPDQARSLRLRAAARQPGNPWHGDVFRVVAAIHDLHPGLDYRTIVGSGNGQTLVWRSTAGGRTPRFDSLEAIARLDWFDLQDHHDLLRAVPEDEAIQACLAGLPPVDPGLSPR
jgi:hypothetical protein